MQTSYIKSLQADKEHIYVVVESIITFSAKYNIFLLEADIGIGKSFLVSSYCKRFGVVSTSPTFAFIHEYVISLDKDSNYTHIYHYDLYVKNDVDSKMKLLESLQREGIHFIEWGNMSLLRSLQSQGFACLLIKITDAGMNRIYDFIES